MKYLTLFFILLASIAEAQVCDFVTPRIHLTDGPPVYELPKFPPTTTTTTTTTLPPGDRIVIWMHGLAGAPGSWSVASGKVDSVWRAHSLRPTYSEYFLGTSAVNIHSAELTIDVPAAMDFEEIEDPNSNFVIAHSQGGLVARAVDRLYQPEAIFDDERMFGGIVTFGTSHGGAQIINSNQNGDLEDFADEACVALFTGPTLSTILDEIPTPFFNPTDSITQLVNGVCNFVANFIIPKFIFDDFNANITDDYKVGSPALTQLNTATANSPIAKVAFYGIENEPVLFRTMHSLFNNPNNSPAFMADADQLTVDRANNYTLMYEMAYIEASEEMFQILDTPCDDPWNWIGNILGCIAATEANILANLINSNSANNELEATTLAWYNGWQWWLRANNEWKTLIGAREYFQTTSCHCVNYTDWGGILNQVTFPSNSVSQCEGMTSYDDCAFVTSYIVVEKQSDGIVLATSAAAFPGAVAGVETRMTGSNHQQMRNDSNLGAKLGRLFEGDYGTYFEVETRQ